MNFWENKRLLVTGGNGFLGTHLIRNLLKKREVRPRNIIVPPAGYDLREGGNCKKILKGVDVIIHLAGLVGGIGFSRAHPGRMFYDNAAMALHLLEAARLEGVEKFVGIGSVCAYPKIVPLPFKEEDLWAGYPEETNASYGLAKKFMLVQSQAYREEYDLNAIHLLMINLYGPGDKFDPESSHVISALLKKVYDAKREGKPSIDAWGTGKPTREFLYIEDAVRGILLAAEKYNKLEPVNLGSGMEISIKKLLTLICKLINYKGDIHWDNSKPDGQPRRRLDVSKAKREFGFEAKTDFEEGLKKTIEWYEEHPF